MPTVWDSSQRMIRRHAIAILISHEGDYSPAFVPLEVYFGWEHGGHSTQDEHYMHQVPLTYMVVFAREASNPGPPIRSWWLYRLGNRGPHLHLKKTFTVSMDMLNFDWFLFLIDIFKPILLKNYLFLITSYKVCKAVWGDKLLMQLVSSCCLC